MKKIISILFSLLIVGISFSQEDIKVVLKEKKFYDNEATAYIVEIPQAKYKDVVKGWMKYLKKHPKEKVTEENGQISIMDKYLPQIANDSIDINSYIKEYDGQIVLAASFKLKGKYVNEMSEEEVHFPTKSYVRNFAIEQYKKAVGIELKEEKRKFDKLNSEMKTLLASNDRFRDNIKKSKRTILTTKDLITLNEMDQSSKVLQIQAQKELIYKLVNSPGDEKKDAEKNLKKIEKDFQKMQTKNKTLHVKIDNLESDIRNNEREIERNEKEQKFLKLDKEDQEYLVRKIKKKLERIE